MAKSSNQEIIKRYSNALYGIAIEEKKHGFIVKDLQKIKDLKEKNKDFNRLFFSPLISSIKFKEILNIISTILKLENITKNFLFLLFFNKRIILFDKIYDYFINVLSRDKNLINIDIILPVEISKKEVDKIQNKLKLKIKNKTKLNFLKDENIISGFIIKLGSKMLDCSIKSKLDKIEDSLR